MRTKTDYPRKVEAREKAPSGQYGRADSRRWAKRLAARRGRRGARQYTRKLATDSGAE